MCMSNCNDSRCRIWYLGWEGKANCKQNTQSFPSHKYMLMAFSQHHLPPTFRRTKPTWAQTKCYLHQNWSPQLRIFLWGPCTGLLFQKRWPVGNSNANDIRYLSASIVPRKGAAGLPIKAQSRKKQTHGCLAIQWKNDWCTIKTDLVGRMQHLQISYPILV